MKRKLFIFGAAAAFAVSTFVFTGCGGQTSDEATEQTEEGHEHEEDTAHHEDHDHSH